MNRTKNTFLALMTVLLSPMAANADVIIEIDISDPSSVVFTPTAAFAESAFLDVDSSFNGITLLDFFTGNITTTDELLDSGSIDVFDSSAGGSRSPLSNIFVDFFPGGWTPDDLSFYDVGAFFVMSFLASETALSGLASHDLSSFTGMSAPGTIGSLVVGPPDQNWIIGQWKIVDVPEPGTLALLALGLAGMGLTRRRKKA